MSSERINELHQQIFNLIGELETLQRSNAGGEVPNYRFATETGEVSLLAMAGIGFEDWTPQYAHWHRPQQMEDGGKDLLE